MHLLVFNPFTARVLVEALYGDSNIKVCGWNPMMWPFKWKLSTCTYTWCYLFFKILENEIWNLVEICFLLNLAVKGLKGLFTNQKVRVPYPFIYLKPEKGTPFGRSLRVLALVGIIPGAIYEVKFVSANTKEPLDNVWLVVKGHRKFRQKIELV